MLAADFNSDVLYVCMCYRQQIKWREYIFLNRNIEGKIYFLNAFKKYIYTFKMYINIKNMKKGQYIGWKYIYVYIFLYIYIYIYTVTSKIICPINLFW